MTIYIIQVSTIDHCSDVSAPIKLPFPLSGVRLNTALCILVSLKRLKKVLFSIDCCPGLKKNIPHVWWLHDVWCHLQCLFLCYGLTLVLIYNGPSYHFCYTYQFPCVVCSYCQDGKNVTLFPSMSECSLQDVSAFITFRGGCTGPPAVLLPNN